MADNKASIEITASSAKFVSEFNRAAASAKGAASQIGNALNGIKGAAAGLGASLSIAGLGVFVKNSIDAADALNDLSKRTGVAATTIGGIGFAAKQAGGDVEGAAQAFRAFNKLSSEALGGNAEAVDNFRKLGISLGDLRKLSPDELLIKTADAFSSFADGAEKAAGATVFFGKGAASVAGVLDEGGESLRKNIEYWKRYSGVTEDLVRASDQFNDSLTKIGLLSRSFGSYLASALLPSLQSLADYLLKAKENSTAFEDAARGVADTIRTLAKFAVSGATTFQQFAMALAATAAQLKAIASLNFAGVMEIERALQEGIARSEERAQGLMRAIDGARKAGASGIGGAGTDGGVGSPGALRKRTPNFTGGSGGSKKEVDEFQRAVERARKELSAANTEYEALFSGGALTKAQKDLAALQASDGWAKLTKPQQEYLAGLYKTAEALERQTEAFKASQDEAARQGKALQERAEEQERLVKSLNDAIGAYAESNKAIEDEIALVGKDARAFALLAAERERDRLVQQAAMADRAQDLPLIEQEYQKRIDLINRLADTVTQFNQKEQIRSIFADSFADELTMVIDGTKSLSDAFRDMEKQIVRSISNIASQNIAAALFGGAGSGGGGIFESLIKGLAGSLGGFASGTSFAPGGLALVGERGPEIVNLPRGSSVTPNNKIGGNVVSINVNVPAGTNSASADRIALVTGQAVQRALRRNG